MLPSSRAWHQEPYILKSRTPWKLSRFSTPLVVSSAEGFLYVSCAVTKERISSERTESSAKPYSQNKISAKLLEENCDWMTFKINPPSASYAGGVWERQIRTILSVLSALLEKSASSLDGESFHTLICETEAIVDNLSDPESTSPMTPNHILTMKTRPVLLPPGIFQKEDLYLRKRWRRVQHLSCEFWTRWKREFLHSLQERSKWTKPRRNMQVGDVVIVTDDNKARNRWSLARVIETYPTRTMDWCVVSRWWLGTLGFLALARECIIHQFWKDPFKSWSCCCQRKPFNGEPLNEEIQKKD